MEENIFSPTDFVAVLNQTLEYAYPSTIIEGELANFRVSKNRWVYFDLKDEYSSVKFFGTVHQLPGPLEDGMMLRVRGLPRLHQLYGFSVNVQFMQPVGEGSIKKAAALLEAKLTAEGLFEKERKRPLPYPPQRIGLITSEESAAFHDFIKVLNGRWSGVEVLLANVQVQGEAAIGQIIAAFEYFNTRGEDIDVLVLTRGGGSAEDRAVFSTEAVTRAVAASRIPTLVAIGHEIDISLAELAADQRASTPSNAAELLVPDKKHVLQNVKNIKQQLAGSLKQVVTACQQTFKDQAQKLEQGIRTAFSRHEEQLNLKRSLLEALNPESALKRGYVILRKAGKVVRSGRQVTAGEVLSVQLHDASLSVKVENKHE